MSPGSSRVTVVIPVWGSPYVETLSAAVASARRQDPCPEIVVVDNASASEVPRLDGVTLVEVRSRVSKGAARNLGLEHVRTPYVVFLDADDLLIDRALAFLVREIERDPGICACATSKILGESGERHRTPRRAAYALSRLPRCFALANAVWSLYPSQGCAILRAADVRATGGYADAEFGEDWVMRSALAFHGRVALRDRPALIYRRHLSASQQEPSVADRTAAARRIRRRLRADPGVPRWAKALLPAVAVGQIAVIRAVQPLYRRLASRATRRDRGRRPVPLRDRAPGDPADDALAQGADADRATQIP